MRSMVAWGAALLAFSLGAAPAQAELFRCTGPDGKTVYTDQKDTCPGADPFEPSGVVHKAVTPPPPSGHSGSAVPASRGADPLAQESAAAQWKGRKAEAEQRVQSIRAEREYLEKYVSHCSRGDYVTTRDDAGIKQVVNCSQLKSQHRDLEQQEAAAREYLETGLADDCRKAGCLPGWVR
jgi:Domain of unknown function (DUF4124)